MKIQFLIALDDKDYSEFLSRILAEKYADTFEVNACSAAERLSSALNNRRYDIVLLAPAFAEYTDGAVGRLTFLLWDGAEELGPRAAALTRLKKYQRISSLVSSLLEHYAEIGGSSGGLADDRAHITVTWSPIGGCGKTTAALAYAAQQVSEGKRTVYLNLEMFSGDPVYFAQSGKSISTVLGRLDGGVAPLLQSIRLEDGGSGIRYFCRPENYDDIAILTAEDIRLLVEGCAVGVDELVVDLPCVCDERTRELLEMAETVLLVVDASRTGQVKWEQFRTQNNIFEMIRSKSILVANRGASVDASQMAGMVLLPRVQSDDPVVVYKTLSTGYFKK